MKTSELLSDDEANSATFSSLFVCCVFLFVADCKRVKRGKNEWMNEWRSDCGGWRTDTHTCSSVGDTHSGSRSAGSRAGSEECQLIVSWMFLRACVRPLPVPQRICSQNSQCLFESQVDSVSETGDNKLQQPVCCYGRWFFHHFQILNLTFHLKKLPVWSQISETGH